VTTFSAHNPVCGGITVLQSQDWWRGKLFGPYKRQSRAEAPGGITKRNKPKIRGRNRTREETETKQRGD
jgi:hypothetical protein